MRCFIMLHGRSDNGPSFHSNEPHIYIIFISSTFSPWQVEEQTNKCTCTEKKNNNNNIFIKHQRWSMGYELLPLLAFPFNSEWANGIYICRTEQGQKVHSVFWYGGPEIIAHVFIVNYRIFDKRWQVVNLVKL